MKARTGVLFTLFLILCAGRTLLEVKAMDALPDPLYAICHYATGAGDSRVCPFCREEGVCCAICVKHNGDNYCSRDCIDCNCTVIRGTKYARIRYGRNESWRNRNWNTMSRIRDKFENLMGSTLDQTTLNQTMDQTIKTMETLRSQSELEQEELQVATLTGQEQEELRQKLRLKRCNIADKLAEEQTLLRWLAQQSEPMGRWLAGIDSGIALTPERQASILKAENQIQQCRLLHLEYQIQQYLIDHNLYSRREKNAPEKIKSSSLEIEVPDKKLKLSSPSAAANSQQAAPTDFFGRQGSKSREKASTGLMFIGLTVATLTFFALYLRRQQEGAAPVKGLRGAKDER